MYQLPFILLVSSVLAIGAFAFSNILTMPDHILGPVSAWAERVFPEWLYKPLIGCQYCVAGQWALWYYFALAFIAHDITYRVDIHFLFILVTIFLEVPITFIYYKAFKS